MCNIVSANIDEITPAQLAVDGNVEQGQIVHLVVVRKVDPDCLDFLGFQWRLLPHQFSYIPRFPSRLGFHDGLLGC